MQRDCQEVQGDTTSRFITPSVYEPSSVRASETDEGLPADQSHEATGSLAPATCHDTGEVELALPQSSSIADDLCYAREVLARSRAAVMQLLSDVRLGRVLHQADVAPVLLDISSSVDQHPSALISCARLKARDEYTYMHSVAVAALMLNLGRRMGLSERERWDAGLAGLLHDVGKMAIPDDILNKPASLSETEFAVMRTHSERGYAMLLASSDIPEIALDVCLHHHERVDGTGYPHGLKGSEISLYARMGAICDVYDAITSRRTYKDAWSPSESLARMYSWKGHFDGEVLQSFIKSLGIYPIGSLVRLSSGLLGVVIGQNEEHALRPVVRCFYSAQHRRIVPAVDIDLSSTTGGDAVVSREQPEAWGFSDWNSFWTKLVA